MIIQIPVGSFVEIAKSCDKVGRLSNKPLAGMRGEIKAQPLKGNCPYYKIEVPGEGIVRLPRKLFSVVSETKADIKDMSKKDYVEEAIDGIYGVVQSLKAAIASKEPEAASKDEEIRRLEARVLSLQNELADKSKKLNDALDQLALSTSKLVAHEEVMKKIDNLRRYA